MSDSREAANGLKSVHAAGTINSGNQHIAIDMQLVGGVGGRGKISVNGLSFQLVGLNHYAYMQAAPAVWRQAGAPAAAAQRLKGKWLRTPATGQVASIARLTDIHQLFGQLLTQRGRKVNRGGVSTGGGAQGRGARRRLGRDPLRGEHRQALSSRVVQGRLRRRPGRLRPLQPGGEALTAHNTIDLPAGS